MKRAYGHEPILLDSSPVTVRPKLSRGQHVSQILRKYRWWIAGAILVAVGLVSIVAAKSSSPGQMLFSRALQDQLGFTLYRPGHLPGGWEPDVNSIEATSDVVTFRVSDGRMTKLLITEQRRPPQPTLDAFYEQQLAGSQSFESGSAKGVIGQFEGSLLAGVTIDGTWVLIRSVSTIDSRQFERIARGMIQD